MAIDLIGRDPGAADVSVIVIDLTGAVIDEAFGAAALEQIVESIENWGAEAIFAGVSPLSEGVVAGLERQPLVLHKDLHAAIAAAFQIAESQRQLL
jgi:anti-anti-sigma regulatory factor